VSYIAGEVVSEFNNLAGEILPQRRTMGWYLETIDMGAI
jgi:hypothetical protein